MVLQGRNFSKKQHGSKPLYPKLFKRNRNFLFKCARWSKKKDRDGYELWLMNDLLLKELGKAISPLISVSFGLVNGKDICRVTVQPGPESTYITIKDPKSSQPVECFFIRTGNSTNKLDKPSDIAKHLANRWGT